MRIVSIARIKKTITCTETTLKGERCSQKAGWHAQFKGLSKVVDVYLCRKHYEILAARELPGLLEERNEAKAEQKAPAYSDITQTEMDALLYDHVPPVIQDLHDKLKGNS